MWKTIKALLVVLSVGFNAAFGAMWVGEAVLGRSEASPPPVTEPAVRATGPGGVWCPLHRSLGTSDAQWRAIEPRLIGFQQAAQALEQETQGFQAQLLDLAAAPQVDREAIRAKQGEIQTCQARMQDLIVAQLLAERQTLTPEQQKALFDQIRQQSGCGRAGQMHMGMGGHGAGRMMDGKEVTGGS